MFTVLHLLWSIYSQDQCHFFDCIFVKLYELLSIRLLRFVWLKKKKNNQLFITFSQSSSAPCGCGKWTLIHSEGLWWSIKPHTTPSRVLLGTMRPIFQEAAGLHHHFRLYSLLLLCATYKTNTCFGDIFKNRKHTQRFLFKSVFLLGASSNCK